MTVLAPWRRIGELLDEGRAVYVVRVVEHTEHSPGTRGAMLWAADADEAFGTIGGGVMELRALERGREWLEAGRRRFRLEDLHHRSDAPGQRSGLVCDGRQTNVSMLLDPATDRDEVARIADELLADRAVIWRVDSDGRLEGRPGDPAPDVLAIDRGESWAVRELLFERRRVAVFGGGHCGAALAAVMAELGWRVDVWESRPSIVADLRRRLEERDLEGVVVHEVADLAEGGPQIAWPRWTPAVVMTTNLAEDVRSLEGLLRRGELPFLGVMGAAAKLAEIRRRLEASGRTPADLDRIVAPVGVPIGSETPQEIAISVAAQLLGRRGDWIGRSVAPVAPGRDAPVTE